MARHTRARPLLLLLLFCVIASNLSTLSVGVDTLMPGQSLVDNQTLVSANSSFVLGFFTSPRSDRLYIGIWYHRSKVSVQTVVWVANRDHPVTDDTGSLSIAGNGTPYITSGNTSIWSSPSLTLRNPVAQLLDNGNLVVRESDSVNDNPKSYAWQSFHYPTDTMLPGMKVGWDLKTGLNSALVAWRSSDDPSPGDYVA